MRFDELDTQKSIYTILYVISQIGYENRDAAIHNAEVTELLFTIGLESAARKKAYKAFAERKYDQIPLSEHERLLLETFLPDSYGAFGIDCFNELPPDIRVPVEVAKHWAGMREAAIFTGFQVRTRYLDGNQFEATLLGINVNRRFLLARWRWGTRPPLSIGEIAANIQYQLRHSWILWGTRRRLIREAASEVLAAPKQSRRIK